MSSGLWCNANLATLAGGRDSGLGAVEGGAVAVEGGQGRYTCTRQIAEVKPGMKEITLVAAWHGLDGRPHTARLITRYGKTGLNDYFYTAH